MLKDKILNYFLEYDVEGHNILCPYGLCNISTRFGLLMAKIRLF
jgi:hypothetical protein